VVLLVAVALPLAADAGGQRASGPAGDQLLEHRQAVRLFSVAPGRRMFRYQIGRETPSTYRGAPGLVEALESGLLRPRTLGSDDFNGDGMADLVIGYAKDGTGVLSLRLGNQQAIAPSDSAVFRGVREGRYPAPFLPQATLLVLPSPADYLEVGDFDADGYADVVAAARGGSTLSLLRGNGHGVLGPVETIDAPGAVTAMRAGPQQLGRMTPLALGLVAHGSPAVSVYTSAMVGRAAHPRTHAMDAVVTSLHFGHLDGDGALDLAAATAASVTVYHGAADQPAGTAESSGSTETARVSFPIAGLAIGDVVFDRGHRNELALLASDGIVHLLARGTPDTRAYSRHELDLIRTWHRAQVQGSIETRVVQRRMDGLVLDRPGPAGWHEIGTLSTGSRTFAPGGHALFDSVGMSGLSTDDLLVGDPLSHRVQVVANQRDAAKTQVGRRAQRAVPTTVGVEGRPLAALPLRLGLNTQPGLVVLGAGTAEPDVIVRVATAFTVTSNADLPDDNPGNNVCHATNGLCTLRAAIIEANYQGGSNSITLAAGTTYTLTKGPFDDEFNALGGTMESGDLDIIDLSAFGRPRLTGVSITGGSGTIIEMGTLDAVAPPPQNLITKDRVLEVNNFVVPQVNINVTLSNLTIRNGVAPRTADPDHYNESGGGIMYDGFDSAANANSGLLTLTNVKVTGNTAAGPGGGMRGIFGSVLVQSGSVVSSNTSQFAAGAGLQYSGGNTLDGQTLTIDNSTIGGALASDGNNGPDATFGLGAGVDTAGGSGFTISNGTIVRNNTGGITTGPSGGGGVHIGNTTNVAFSNSTISDNKSKHNGGGIWSSTRNAVTNAPSTLTLTGLTVQNNQADSDNTGAGNGGGILNFFGALTITNTAGGSITGNSAVNGGGIFSTWAGIAADAPASITVTGSGANGAISSNSAKNNGGGIAVDPGGSPSLPAVVSLNGVTLKGNVANSDNSGGGDGGAIHNNGGAQVSITLGNSSAVTIGGTGAGEPNAAVNGGGIANASGSLAITSSTFGGNTATGVGDGLYVSGGSVTGSGTVNLNGVDGIHLAGGSLTSTSGTLNLTGNLTNSGGTFTHNGGTVNLNGPSVQTIGGTTPMTFATLTLANTGGATLGNNETVNTALNLTDDALGVGANTLTLNGTVSFTGGSITSSASGTVSYAKGTNTQNVAPGSYGNLTFSNFTKTLPSGTTVGIAGTFTPGSAVGHTITGSTVDFNGSGGQTIPTFAYNNLTSSNSGTRTLASSGTVGIAGTFTPGTNAYTVTGSTVDFNGSGGQTIPAFNYNNLTSSNSGARTLQSSGTIGVAGTFTPGANAYTITGSTVDYNGTGAQSLPSAFTSYNNLTVSGARGGASVTLPALTVGVAGAFTPSATGVTYVKTGNTIDFNGSGPQTIPAFAYNNLTSSSSGARTLQSSGTIGVAGTFTPGANAYTVIGSTVDYNGTAAQLLPAFPAYANLTISQARGGASVTLPASSIGVSGVFTPSATAVSYVKTGNTIDFNGGGAQTIPAFAYNNLTSSNSGARTLASSGTVGVAGTFTPGTNAYTVTGSTVDFNGSGAQTVPAFNYNNLTSSSTGARTLASSGSVGIAGTFTPGGNAYTITDSTVVYNGSSAQTLPAAFTPYNNLTINNPAGATGFGGLTVQGLLRVQAGTFTSSSIYKDVQIESGATLTAAPASTINVSGSWTNNGTFTPGSGTVVFNSTSGAQTIGGSAASQSFFNLTVNKSGQTLNVGGSTSSLSVGGTLTISAGTLDAGTAATINVGGNWTNNAGAGGFTGGAGTVVFNGVAAQTIGGATTFNNLTINNAAGVTGPAGLTVTGTLTVQLGTFTSASSYKDVVIENAGTLAASPASTITVNGDWTDKHSAGSGFTPGTGTVVFAKAGTATLSLLNQAAGAETFCNLTVNSGTVLAVGADLATLAGGAGCGTLTNNGRVDHAETATVGAGSASFNDAFNHTAFDLSNLASGLGSTTVTVAAGEPYPPGFDDCGVLPFSRVSRYWQAVPTTVDSATVRLWFKDASERNGLTLSSLKLWKCTAAGGWTQVGTNYQTSSAPDANGYDYFQADGVTLGSSFVVSQFGTTAVTITSFRATAARPLGVKLSWRTASELSLLGFNMWRRTPTAKSWTKLNPRLLPARTRTARGAAYSFTDRTALRGRTYTYRLDLIAAGGDRRSAGTRSLKLKARR
jgi:CSLREA domain-containing protein